MGYRSEVALAVSAEARPHFMAKLAGCEKARQLVFDHSDDLDTNFRGKGGLLVTWEYLKWYPSYEEIKCIESFMDDMDHGMVGVLADEEYRFCRIGENTDDLEERGCLEAFDIQRRIEIC